MMNSTAAFSGTAFARFDPGPEPAFEPDTHGDDVEMTIEDDGNRADESDVMEYDLVSKMDEDRLIIAIDFGTTFSSVAYTVLPKGVPPERMNVGRVRCIGNYPGYEPPLGVQHIRQDVPTELWYDDSRIKPQRDRYFRRPNEDRRSVSEDEESSSSNDDISEGEQSQFEEDNGLEAIESNRVTNAQKAPATQYWGFGVQQKLSMTDIPRDEARPLTRFKLNLDQTQETEDLRAETRTILKTLMKKRIINSTADIYSDYLSHLLKHTKEQLLASKELHQNMLIQFVLCVPAKWPMNACRIMQTALEQAVKEVGFNEQANSSVHDMFMISEPEAAAECILAEAKSEVYVSSAVLQPAMAMC